jgi:hypothetical protein
LLLKCVCAYTGSAVFDFFLKACLNENYHELEEEKQFGFDFNLLYHVFSVRVGKDVPTYSRLWQRNW